MSQDTDGLTNPFQAGMQWAVRMDKPFFVGQRSLRILAAQPLSQVLVGFVLADDAAGVPKECHLVIRAGELGGRVTSIAHSPILKRVIGMALLELALAAQGNAFRIRIDGGVEVGAVVTALPFYDPAGERQRAPSIADRTGAVA